MMGVSLRAYARMRGCSLTAVQKAISSKRITTLADGTIDPERANQEWAKNTFAGQTIHKASAAPSDRLPPVHESPAAIGRSGYRVPAGAGGQGELRGADRPTGIRGARRQADPGGARGRVCREFSSIVKDGLMAMPDRLAPMLAAVDDEKAIHRMLVAEVSAVLRKVSKAVADAGL